MFGYGFVKRTSVDSGMAEKWRKDGIGNADDMEIQICYTDTVYKWVSGNLLLFFAEGVRYDEILSLLRLGAGKRRRAFLL